MHTLGRLPDALKSKSSPFCRDPLSDSQWRQTRLQAALLDHKFSPCHPATSKRAVPPPITVCEWNPGNESYGSSTQIEQGERVLAGDNDGVRPYGGAAGGIGSTSRRSQASRRLLLTSSRHNSRPTEQTTPVHRTGTP